MNPRTSTMQQIAPAAFAACPFAPGDVIWAYLRYSTGDQNISSQSRALREWCEMHNLVLARIFQDEAISGTTTAGRDDFMRMIELLRNPHLIANPKPKGVAFWSLARFARDFDDSQFFKSDLRRRGYLLHSMIDAIPAGLIGRVVESIHDYKNEAFVEQMKIEVRRGLYDLAAQGYAIGGFPPRGYKRSAPVSLGKKKNGEERLAHKWEIDPDLEDRVRQAWHMRLAGKGHWDIHKQTKIFKTIGCYATFFTNITYAGYRKCGASVFPNAHAGYVTKEEFDRAQTMRRTFSGNPKAPMGDPNHSRRHRSSDPFSGILYCACGGLMVVRSDHSTPFYQCGRQQRQGRDICNMPTLVAWYLREFVYKWLAVNVITFARLARARDEINRQLSGDQGQMQARLKFLEEEKGRIERAARNLYDTVEVTGLTEELRKRLRERTLEMRQTETELAQIQQMLKQQRLEVGDDVLRYVAEHMAGRLLNGKPDEVRSIVRQTLVRIELDREEVRLHYVPPLVQPMSIPCNNAVPPWEEALIASFALPVTVAVAHMDRPKTGRASPKYGASVREGL